MDDEKVYHAEVIADNPFPGQQAGSSAASTARSAEVYVAQTIPEKVLPTKRIATELIATALNTKSRKILGEFSFTESGAIQIGKYENGVSGDMRLTPNGLVGRNAAGLTMIAFDIETGSAIFAGEIRSGTLIAGQVAVGDDSIHLDGENKRILLYNNDGLPSIVLGNGKA